MIQSGPAPECWRAALARRKNPGALDVSFAARIEILSHTIDQETSGADQAIERHLTIGRR